VLTVTEPALSPAAWATLACPHCTGELERAGDTLTCAGCGEAYAVAGGQVDLRLRRPKDVTLPLTIEPLADTAARRRRPSPIPLNPAGPTDVDPGAYPGSLANGNGLTRELASWIPPAAPGALMLDMGCGDRRCEPVLRLGGHEYVGLDIAGEDPDVLGIGEALPFRDESFDFVFTLSVVPHTAHPLVVMREIARVLKPGGRYIGTMEFLEPCHMQSRHHVTALGVQDWIDFSGFELVELEANDRWLGANALLKMGFFPRLSWEVNGRLGDALAGLHRLQTRGQRRAPSTSPVGEGLPERITGGFRFVADKPS
jgi:SAM-dependent methyltransferase